MLLEVELDPPPGKGEVHRALGQVAQGVGGVVARWGYRLVAWSPLEALNLKGVVRERRYRLWPQGPQPLDPARPPDREALTSLARNWLRGSLRQAFPDRRLEGLHLLGKAPAREGRGWQLYEGAWLDVFVDAEGQLWLEVDLRHRLEATLSLEDWLAQGHELPARARNAYGEGRTWEVVRLGDEDPKDLILENGLTLLEYHRRKGHLNGEAPGRVVWVRDPRRPRERVPHLTGLLVPIPTLEDLEEPQRLQILPGDRLRKTLQVAQAVARRVFGLQEVEPQKALAHLLPRPSLVGKEGKRLGKPADALRVGALRAQPAGVALLRLDGGRGWPPRLRELLLKAAAASGVEVRLLEAPDLSLERELAFRRGLAALRAQGVEALLVLTPPLPWEVRHRLKALALQEGLPTQLLNTPLGEGEEHRLTNALLGLLVKLGWQLLALEGEYPAELAVGFDAGGQRTLRFGGGACAVLGDGSALGWLLPQAQVGERIPEEAVWDLLLESLELFREAKGRLPRRVLLLRDGRIPKEEFSLALAQLREEGIAYDLLSVRKSGGGRVYPVGGGRLADGLMVPLEEGAFLLLTVHREGRGTPQPLKVVREEGDGDLRALARQLYHLTRLYPASGYFFPRLPAPLHLADRLTRETARIRVRPHPHLDFRRLFFV